MQKYIEMILIPLNVFSNYAYCVKISNLYFHFYYGKTYYCIVLEIRNHTREYVNLNDETLPAQHNDLSNGNKANKRNTSVRN